MADFDDYAWLIGDDAAAWLERMAHDDGGLFRHLELLRRELSTERARLIADQLDMRRSAVSKFGDLAAGMFFMRQRLEQATDIWTARYKASRLVRAEFVADYCCGIGGDLIAFAERGAAAGWDISPEVCLLAKANLGDRATIHCADVATVRPEACGSWHLDPDRREAEYRVTKFSLYAPRADLAMAWLPANPHGFVKLAPATVVPENWAAAAELEWITFNRECRQQVAWLGPLAECAGRRRATVVRRDGEPASFVGDADRDCQADEAPGRYVFDPAPSLLAARLLGSFAIEHNLASLGAGSAYLTADAPCDHALVSQFSVVDCLPLRTGEIAKCLTARGVGKLEIKTRGVEPDDFRHKLKLRGDNAATLILTRIGKRHVAIVAERESH